MLKLDLDEKFSLYAKEGNNIKFFGTFIGYSLLVFFVLSILSIILAPFLGTEAMDNFVQNMWIRILFWMMTVTISSSFMWQSYSELMKFPDKENEKSMWFHILSVGVFGVAFILPMFNTDYVGESFGQIFAHHLFYMITLGILAGYISWGGRNFERLKEIFGERNKIL
ncbi:MAG: hypothetical protein KAH33_02205 [Candidatus Delongbacteria bacterium]|nr:hypothetical protein [Candidatus Delongbacteria bacterium]